MTHSLLYALALAMCIGGHPAAAQTADPTAEDILTALLPHGMDGRRIAGARSIDGVLGGDPSRGIGVEDGGTGPIIPSIDLRVGFEYDSAVLTNDGALLLDQLGQALADPTLATAQIRIIGHTDAAGTEGYNQTLSEQRAAAVRAYVIDRHGVDATRLEVLGRGKAGLLPDIDPLDARNRRVEVQNISAAPDCSAGQPCARLNSGG